MNSSTRLNSNHRHATAAGKHVASAQYHTAKVAELLEDLGKEVGEHSARVRQLLRCLEERQTAVAIDLRYAAEPLALIHGKKMGV